MVASHNNLLGRFQISEIPPKLEGREKVDVSFSYDLNGILNVTATLVSTGKTASIRINMTKEEEKEREEDLSGWKKAEGAKAYRSVIRTTERLLSKKNDALPPSMRERVQEALDDLKRAIIAEDAQEAEERERELSALLDLARDEE